MSVEELGSVRNAARLLRVFTSKDRVFGVTELARKLGLSTSTTHRLLTTLALEHLIEQDVITGKYRLGLAVYDLTAAAAVGFDLSEAVLPPMSLLRAQTGETVQVAVLDGRQVVYVERLDSTHTLRFFLELGRRNWAHCTATGKALLAQLGRVDLDQILDGWELPALTGHTITDPDQLRKQLSEARDLGYAVNLHESEDGVMSVAAPIRNASAITVAALSVAGPASRMERDMIPISYGVMEAAAVASRRLGYSQRSFEM